MAGLGDVVAELANLRKGLSAAGAGRMVQTASFGSNPGALRMLSFVPGDLPPGAALVVTLHGCGQGAAAYADNAGWLTLAERHGFAVLAPEQVAANNPGRCFNWFSPEDIRRDGGEAASIAAMVRHMVETYGLDPARVFVTGLSAGGAMTSVMLATYSDLFASGAIIAGLPYGVAGDVQSALGAMHRADVRSGAALADLVRAAGPSDARVPRVMIWHGQSDSTVQVANAESVARQWVWRHDLAPEPDERRVEAGATRSLWRAPSGEVLVELNLLSGLGHGVPLATRGPEGLGSTAPYMLEAGVSSSMEILRFWGLADARAGGVHATPSALSKVRRPKVVEPEAPVAKLGDQVMATLSTVPPAVQSVIAKALKSAGLMR